MPKIPFKYTLFGDSYKAVILSSLFIFLGLIFFAYLSKFLGEIGEDFIFYRLFGIKRTSIVIVGSVGIVAVILVHIGYLSKVSKLPKSRQEKLGVFTRAGIGMVLTIARIFEAARADLSVSRSRAPYCRGDQALILGLAMPVQALFLFSPLVFTCDAGMFYDYGRFLTGSPGSGFTDHLPPGFPVFLVATGQYFFNTFSVTVMAYVAMGILSPVLLYRTVYPIHRIAALGAAIVYIVSMAPFLSAKSMLPDQLFVFLLLASVYAVSRYYITRLGTFIYASVFLGSAAWFTQWEGVVPLAVLVVAIAVFASKQKSHYRHLLVSLLIVGGVALTWSVGLDVALKDISMSGKGGHGSSQEMLARPQKGAGPTWPREQILKVSSQSSEGYGALGPLVSMWRNPHDRQTVFNQGNCAKTSLPASLFEKYRRDFQKGSSQIFQEIFDKANLLRGIIYKGIGLAALVTWWFLPFSRQRAFLLYVASSSVGLILVAEFFAGEGASQYGQGVLPLALIATAGALIVIKDTLRKLLLRRQAL
ncbi:MAG: hypothetical protein ISR48_00490 [Alphaproteobacteria bacterium]|nr:hypothetical protein [Alphaproteobacteria bacterium]